MVDNTGRLTTSHENVWVSQEKTLPKIYYSAFWQVGGWAHFLVRCVVALRMFSLYTGCIIAKPMTFLVILFGCFLSL